MSKAIRNSVKAVIIQDRKVLVIRLMGQDGPFYLLPGGGQEWGETFHEALRRECREEINAGIEIGRLLFIREYIGKNHEFAKSDAGLHQIEYMFECTVKDTSSIRVGSHPDMKQDGVEWLELDHIREYRLYPRAIQGYLRDIETRCETVYLGDVN